MTDRTARDLIVFGEDWGAHPSSTQHLVGRMAADRRVLWANSIGLRRPRLGIGDLGRAARKLAGTRSPGREGGIPAPFPVIQPIVAPMARSRPLRALNRALLARSVGNAARAAGLRHPVLWTSLPSAVDAVGALGESAVVYYCPDDFGSLAGVDHAVALEMERELVERADLIVAASEALAARFPGSRTHLVPHGVDLDLFGRDAARAADLPCGAPVAGFYGSLAEWIDVELVADTARLLPGWRFVLVGPVQTDVSALLGLPNVFLLGNRPHAALPGYARHWQAALIPFRDTPQIRACNPLKLREYLAAGRPVVSTPFPALAPYAGLVSVATDAAGFAAALRASLDEAPDAALRRASRVATESWDARAARVAALVDGLTG